MGSNVTAAWRIYKKGAYFANPCFTQIHPTCIPVSGDHQSKLTLMSESLRKRWQNMGAQAQKRCRSYKDGQAEAYPNQRARQRLLFRKKVPRIW